MNFPGWFACSAIALFCFQTVPATSGCISSLYGFPLIIDSPRNR